MKQYRKAAIPILLVLFMAACTTTVAPTLVNSPDATTALSRLTDLETSFDHSARAVNGGLTASGVLCTLAPNCVLTPAMATSYTTTERANVIAHAQIAQSASRTLHGDINQWTASGTKPATFGATAKTVQDETDAAKAGVHP